MPPLTRWLGRVALKTSRLGFYIPRLGFPIPGTGFKTLSGELGFWIPVLVGFQIRWALFRIPQAKFQIQDSKILIFLHGTRHETETLKGQQLGGKKTEAMFTLRIAFRISTKSYPIGLSGIVTVWTATARVYTQRIRYPVGRPFTTIKKKRLAIEPFPMHRPRFETVSRNHWSHSKIWFQHL